MENTYSTGTSPHTKKKDLHVKHGCSMPHALASRGDRYHDCRERAGGGRREIRSLGAVLQGARSVASVLQSLSMTMAWMPLAVPMEFFVRGHGRDDFDLSFVTEPTLPTLPTPSHLPTYLYYLLPQSDSACAHPPEPRHRHPPTLPVHSLPT